MRVEPFAAIADVHGNRWALEAVPSDIQGRGIRQIANLGDHLFGPLDVDGTAEIPQGLDLPSVSGNQDREMLGRKQGAWLASLPFRLELPGMLLFHGTPVKDYECLLDSVRSEGVTLATAGEVCDRLGPGPFPPMLLCGLTHIPRTVLCDSTLIVNPGSVGLQAYADDTPLSHVMETGSPHARYAILEGKPDGWHVEHIQIPYNWEAAAEMALRNGRPDWAFRLRNGRAVPT